MQNKCFYPVVIKEEEGGWSAVFVDFELATCGDNLQDALQMAHEALAGYLYEYKDVDDSELPAATPLEKVSLKNGENAYMVCFNPDSDLDLTVVTSDLESAESSLEESEDEKPRYDDVMVFLPSDKVAQVKKRGLNIRSFLIRALDAQLAEMEK